MSIYSLFIQVGALFSTLKFNVLKMYKLCSGISVTKLTSTERKYVFLHILVRLSTMIAFIFSNCKIITIHHTSGIIY